MKKSQYSEKFYEFAVNHELLNKMVIDIYIPSQSEEALLGWDIGFTDYKQLYFFQYKTVSEYDRIPRYLSTHAFRFQLHKDTKGKFTQNNHLCNLNKMGFIAGYVVPNFTELSNLRKHIKKARVLSNSFLMIPLHISKGSSHYINFDKSQAFQHSKENRQITKRLLSEVFDIEFENRTWESDKDKIIEMILTQNNESIIHEGNKGDKIINDFLFKNSIMMVALKNDFEVE